VGDVQKGEGAGRNPVKGGHGKGKQQKKKRQTKNADGVVIMEGTTTVCRKTFPKTELEAKGDLFLLGLG